MPVWYVHGLGHQISKSYLNNPSFFSLHQKTARKNMAPPDFLWLHWCFKESVSKLRGNQQCREEVQGEKYLGTVERGSIVSSREGKTQNPSWLGFFFGSERSSLTIIDYARIWREDLDSTRVTRGEATAAYRLGISTCSPVARAKPAAKRLTNLQSRHGSWWQFDKGSLVACGNDA